VPRSRAKHSRVFDPGPRSRGCPCKTLQRRSDRRREARARCWRKISWTVHGLRYSVGDCRLMPRAEQTPGGHFLNVRPRFFISCSRAVSAFGPNPCRARSSARVCRVRSASFKTPIEASARCAGFDTPAGKSRLDAGTSARGELDWYRERRENAGESCGACRRDCVKLTREFARHIQRSLGTGRASGWPDGSRQLLAHRNRASFRGSPVTPKPAALVEANCVRIDM
jgi:hypothetical protein